MVSFVGFLWDGRLPYGNNHSLRVACGRPVRSIQSPIDSASVVQFVH